MGCCCVSAILAQAYASNNDAAVEAEISYKALGNRTGSEEGNRRSIQYGSVSTLRKVTLKVLEHASDTPSVSDTTTLPRQYSQRASRRPTRDALGTQKVGHKDLESAPLA